MTPINDTIQRKFRTAPNLAASAHATRETREITWQKLSLHRVAASLHARNIHISLARVTFARALRHLLLVTLGVIICRLCDFERATPARDSRFAPSESIPSINASNARCRRELIGEGGGIKIVRLQPVPERCSGVIPEQWDRHRH
jgi:hypothetical protein